MKARKLRASDVTFTVEAEFTHRGRPYVAIRFRGGRVELYRVTGGLEEFMRYAVPGRALDDQAIGLVGDRLDEAAKMARDLLLGLYPTARNVRMGPACGEWGSVIADDFVHPQTGRRHPLYASIRLFNAIGGGT